MHNLFSCSFWWFSYGFLDDTGCFIDNYKLIPARHLLYYSHPITILIHLYVLSDSSNYKYKFDGTTKTIAPNTKCYKFITDNKYNNKSRSKYNTNTDTNESIKFWFLSMALCIQCECIIYCTLWLSYVYFLFVRDVIAGAIHYFLPHWFFPIEHGRIFRHVGFCIEQAISIEYWSFIAYFSGCMNSRSVSNYSSFNFNQFKFLNWQQLFKHKLPLNLQKYIIKIRIPFKCCKTNIYEYFCN